jgi:hypothetical protein
MLRVLAKLKEDAVLFFLQNDIIVMLSQVIARLAKNRL